MKRGRRGIFLFAFIMIVTSACQKIPESLEDAADAFGAGEMSSGLLEEEYDGANPEQTESVSTPAPMEEQRESVSIPELMDEQTENGFLSALMEREWFYGDDALYLVKMHDVQKIPTGFFSAQVTTEEGDLGELSFRWYLYEDSIYMEYDWEEDMPIRCTIDSIPGCTTAVLLHIASDQIGGGYHFMLCDLEKNILVDPFAGRLSEYDSIDTLVLSPDLTEALFTTNKSTSAYLINEQEIRLLFSDVDQVNGMWLEEALFLCVLDLEETGSACMDGYLYHAEQDMLLQTVSGRPTYRSEQLDGKVSGALAMYGCAYAACFESGMLHFLDLRSGERISTELSQSKITLENVKYVGNGYFRVVVPDEGTEFLLEAESGSVVAEKL